MSRWLGSMLLVVFTALAASGPAAAQADDLNALDQQFRALYSQGKYGEAVAVGERVLKLTEQARGPNDLAAAAALNNLAIVYQALGRYEEALKACGRALAIQEKALGPEHPYVATTLNNLAVLGIAQRDWAQVQDYWQRATQILEHRTSLGVAGLGQPLAGKGRSEATRSGGYFQGLVKAAWRRAGEGGA